MPITAAVTAATTAVKCFICIFEKMGKILIPTKVIASSHSSQVKTCSCKKLLGILVKWCIKIDTSRTVNEMLFASSI